MTENKEKTLYNGSFDTTVCNGLPVTIGYSMSSSGDTLNFGNPRLEKWWFAKIEKSTIKKSTQSAWLDKKIVKDPDEELHIIECCFFDYDDIT